MLLLTGLNNFTNFLHKYFRIYSNSTEKKQTKNCLITVLLPCCRTHTVMIIGTLSNHDDDGRENGTSKTIQAQYLMLFFFSLIYFELPFRPRVLKWKKMKERVSGRTENKLVGVLKFPFSTEREIWTFHVVVLQNTVDFLTALLICTCVYCIL